MKGPNDNMLLPEGDIALTGATATTGSAKARLVKPSGGKALARLQQFAAERGLPIPEPQRTEDEQEENPPAKKPKSKAATKKATEEPLESSDNADRLTISYVEEVIAAAQDLQRTTASFVPLPESAAGQAGVNTSGNPMGPLTGPPTGIGPQWRFLGPIGMTNGQTYGDSRVIVSGRIAAIAVDPSNANHILCGSAGGGIWESYDKGAHWTPRTDYMPTLTVGAIAFSPANAHNVFCGTGEGNFYGSLGAGLMRSTDGGANWAMLATNPFVGSGFYDLVIDPGNANRMFAGTTAGLYLSTDAGASWTLLRGARCWSISIHSTTSSLVRLNTTEIFAACSDGLFRSTNGTTWTAVALPGGPGGYNRLAVSHCKSNPAVVHVFGTGAPNMRVPGDSDPTHLQTTPYLWRRSVAAGAFAAGTLPSDLATGQAWYDWYIATAPDMDSQVYIGAIEAYRGTLSGTTWSWIKISNKAGDDIHPDQHCIAFDPTNANIIYAGCDGGLFTSPNRGVSWTSLNPGLGITEVEYMAQDYGSVRYLIAGTQDNGSIRYNGTSAWDHIADGDGGDCGINRTNPQIAYHSFFNMGMERSTTGAGFGSFSWIGPNVPNTYSNLFYPPMEVFNNTVAQAGQSVFISRNQGTNWTEIGLPSGQVGSAMFIPNADTVFVGTTTGRLYRISWNGSAWGAATALTTPRANAFVSDIHVTPANTSRIWVTYSSIGGGRVFRSDNGGTSWTDCSAGLPNLPINAVEVDPGNANRVWVAADVGVYQTTNAGSGWTAFANSLPNCIASDLLYHPNARVLRCGTRNRGVWEIPVDGWLTNPVCGTQFTGTINGGQTARWYTFNWPATWHMIWTVMPTTPIPGNPELKWQVQVERASAEYVTYWIVVTNLTNQPVSFEGRFAILSYY